MRNLSRWSLTVALFLVIVACKKSSSETPAPTKDTTVPTISLVDPTAGKSYVLGSPLHLQMDLTDNVELKSYKVTIAKSSKGLQTTDWGFSQTWIIAAAPG